MLMVDVMVMLTMSTIIPGTTTMTATTTPAATTTTYYDHCHYYTWWGHMMHMPHDTMATDASHTGTHDDDTAIALDTHCRMLLYCRSFCFLF